MRIKTIGFPRMPRKKGEKRDFLPNLFARLAAFEDIGIFLEEGYGKAMGFTEDDYLKKHPNLKFVSHDETYRQDVVVVLRAPNEVDINKMKEKSILISMLHFDTRPIRNKLLKSKKIISYSMDSMVDDENNRIVVNYWGTSMSGAVVAFNQLKRKMKDFYSQTRRPINVSIIGFGRVGTNAAKAFSKLGNKEFYDNKIPGLIVKILPRSITRDIEVLKHVLSDTDILVDATWRPDTSKIIVPNRLISHMPEHAIILDLTADPYNDKIKPLQQKAIEGIPTGTLEKYVIQTNDEMYDNIPEEVNTSNRRAVVSCNAWPGVHPIEAMATYGKQIFPFLKILLEMDELQTVNINSNNLYERALVRASLDYYLDSLNKDK